jgi:protease IV
MELNMDKSEPTNQSSPNKWEQKTIENLLMAGIKEQRSARRWGIFFKLAFFAYLFVLLIPFVTEMIQHTPVSHHHVALIDVHGMIEEGRPASADFLSTSLRHAYENKKVEAIVLRINSPGGTPVQAGYMYDEIIRLKVKHPDIKVYAVITDVAASGGYYVASACDEIYADKASFVGSIGAIFPLYGVTEVMKKVGVENRTITAGKNKAFLDPFSPSNPEQIAFAQKLVSNVHDQFIAAVKKGRGKRLKSEDADIFSGLIWTGEQALQLGLIDGLGSSGYVVREKVGNEHVVDYTIRPNVFESFAERLGTSFSSALAHTLSSTPVLK